MILPFDSLSILFLSGGFGTRLRRSLPNKTPKILAPICNKPFLDYLYIWISSLSPHSIPIYLATGHLHDIASNYCISNSLPIRTIKDPLVSGTLSAAAHASLSIHSDYLLILNGDTLFDFNLPNFLDKFFESPLSPLLLIKDNQYDVASGYSIHTPSKRLYPDYQSPDYISMGACLCSATHLRYFYNRSLFLRSNHMMDDNYLHMCSPRYHIANSENFFIDIGTPDDLIRAQELIPAFVNSLP